MKTFLDQQLTARQS